LGCQKPSRREFFNCKKERVSGPPTNGIIGDYVPPETSNDENIESEINFPKPTTRIMTEDNEVLSMEKARPSASPLPNDFLSDDETWPPEVRPNVLNVEKEDEAEVHKEEEEAFAPAIIVFRGRTITSDDLINSNLCGAPYASGSKDKLSIHHDICPGLIWECKYCGLDDEHPSKFSNPGSHGMHMKRYHKKEHDKQLQDRPKLRRLNRRLKQQMAPNANWT
jgi:hypothetical protein